jgi:hypothetical protein
MSQLQILRAASTRSDVAVLLQFKPQALAYILHVLPPSSKYQAFKIAKRNGNVREIHAPSPELKLMQRRLCDLLQNCVAEINEQKNFRDQLSHGFKRGKTIITNATKHRKRRFVFNLDLKDFFPAINFGRVRGFFIKDANFMLHPAVATVIAQIACFNNELPQGSPCSPVISNLIAHPLDLHLCKIASVNGCTYSRYADDITFSTNRFEFPAGIATPSASDPHLWQVGHDVEEAIAHSGFAINPTKTRMQYKHSRQAVTGLVVNRKANVRADYRRAARIMALRLFATGAYQHIRTIANANGVLTPTLVDGTLRQLAGKFAHINRVDKDNADKEEKTELKKGESQTTLRAKEKLYRRFLLFKEFYSADAPIIVCEGKTDNVYLLHAIRGLAQLYPQLATVSPSGEIKLTIRILKTLGSTVGRVFRLGEGSADLAGLIDQYLPELQRFKAPGIMKNPAILLFDNDDAAESVYEKIRKLTKNKSISKGDPFVHVAGNLYVVVTPLKSGKTKTTIEDCFADEIINLNLGGKVFSSSNKADPSKYFGKHILSQYVRQNAAKIDFTGFTGLLDRIIAVISHYQSLQVSAGANGVSEPAELQP